MQTKLSVLLGLGIVAAGCAMTTVYDEQVVCMRPTGELLLVSAPTRATMTQHSPIVKMAFKGGTSSLYHIPQGAICSAIREEQDNYFGERIDRPNQQQDLTTYP